MGGRTQNLGRIGSVVLMFIGHKQTGKHPDRTDKQSIYIEKKIPFWL